MKTYYVAPTSSGCQLYKTACQIDAYIHLLTNKEAALRIDVEIATVYRRIYFTKLLV